MFCGFFRFKAVAFSWPSSRALSRILALTRSGFLIMEKFEQGNLTSLIFSVLKFNQVHLEELNDIALATDTKVNTMLAVTGSMILFTSQSGH